MVLLSSNPDDVLIALDICRRAYGELCDDKSGLLHYFSIELNYNAKI